ncbi:hypothetical protein F783_003920 [Bordetella holmesii F627]|nr:transposase [Bordetella holmesii H558]AMD50511.1 hypothetical protein F783_003920 [Bordetella holmesii F627]
MIDGEGQGPNRGCSLSRPPLSQIAWLTQRGGGLGPSELRRLRQLEEECNRLKRLVADLSLDKAILQDVLAKKL